MSRIALERVAKPTGARTSSHKHTRFQPAASRRAALAAVPGTRPGGNRIPVVGKSLATVGGVVGLLRWDVHHGILASLPQASMARRVTGLAQLGYRAGESAGALGKLRRLLAWPSLHGCRLRCEATPLGSLVVDETVLSWAGRRHRLS